MFEWSICIRRLGNLDTRRQNRAREITWRQNVTWTGSSKLTWVASTLVGAFGRQVASGVLVTVGVLVAWQRRARVSVSGEAILAFAVVAFRLEVGHAFSVLATVTGCFDLNEENSHACQKYH